MRAMTNSALSRFNPAQPGAAGMKVVATGLLLVMAGLFFAARALEHQYPWLGYLKSFAEAAMVGGLADWFAVTALFRHPLGLPIPHTAIIPRNKDRIGEALATFLKENFLIPSVVARRMRKLDVAGAAGRFLQTPAGEGTRIRAGASRLIADMFESLDDERLGGIVKSAISTRLRDQRGAPRTDAGSGDSLDRAGARCQRAADPRHGQEEGQLGAQARRARREARRCGDRGPPEADGRNVDRPRASGAHEDRTSARPARERSSDETRDSRTGRGDQGAIARQHVR